MTMRHAGYAPPLSATGPPTPYLFSRKWKRALSASAPARSRNSRALLNDLASTRLRTTITRLALETWRSTQTQITEANVGSQRWSIGRPEVVIVVPVA